MTTLIIITIILAVGCLTGVYAWLMDRKTIRDLDEQLKWAKATMNMRPVVIKTNHPLVTLECKCRIHHQDVFRNETLAGQRIKSELAYKLAEEVLKVAEVRSEEDIRTFEHVIKMRVRVVDILRRRDEDSN